MTKDEIVSKHKEYLFKCVATYYKDPLVLDHGKGQYLCDVDGKKYLDFLGGIVTISVGHANERVTLKIKAQIDRLQHASTLFPSEPIVALAEKMAQIAPGKLQKSYFTNSGSEANEVAVLTARMHTGNYDVLALRHGYSGHTQLTKSLTGIATWRKAGIVPFGIIHAPGPYCYRCPYGLSYPSCELHCAKDVEEVIKTSTGGAVAGLLAETIQGLGGVVVPPPGYFKIVANIVRNYGGLFISDEVQAGFGRTGKRWFGIEHWEVEPDIMTCAKGMANGVPIGCTITRQEIADSFKGLTISTFGGNPVTCVAAKATIDLIEEDRLMDNAETTGKRFRQGLDGLKEKHASIGDVRGMGLMMGVELVKDHKTKEPAGDLATKVLERARANGLVIGKGGLYANVLRMSPPLNISVADVDQAVAILDKSLEEAAKG
ncbi:MAG: aspartate aminotransferase family protein [Acidobacteria bacterium]|nr:MAG: aspartate aminotransferase family protein [Acidobacteriota bacterium]